MWKYSEISASINDVINRELDTKETMRGTDEDLSDIAKTGALEALRNEKIKEVQYFIRAYEIIISNRSNDATMQDLLALELEEKFVTPKYGESGEDEDEDYRDRI